MPMNLGIGITGAAWVFGLGGGDAKAAASCFWMLAVGAYTACLLRQPISIGGGFTFATGRFLCAVRLYSRHSAMSASVSFSPGGIATMACTWLVSSIASAGMRMRTSAPGAFGSLRVSYS